MPRFPRLLGLLAWCGLLAQAANIYVITGNVTTDLELRRTLESFGHFVTLGASFSNFDGRQSLAGVDIVYLQVYHWEQPVMPVAGQTALVNFVNRGGGLVTTEWLLWLAAEWGSFTSALSTLEPILPLQPYDDYDSLSSVTFTQDVADGELNAGLPERFRVPLDDNSGSHTMVPPSGVRTGASSFYTMDGGFVAVAGWNVGSGRVLSFTTINGETQLRDASFRRLLGNAITWATRPTVAEGGVVNAATLASGQPVAPGSLVSIFGWALSSSPASAGSIPLPNSLAGVSVTVNGLAAPLISCPRCR
jgi:hypothetical protein